MRKRVRIALAVLLVALVGVLGWESLREREPVYQGKPVTVWIREGCFPPTSGVTLQQANEAVLAVGTRGLPYYVRLLETRGDSHLKSKVVQWLETQPRLQLDFSFSSSETTFRRIVGVYGLSILGVEAKPAIPALAKLLTSGDDEQMSLAAETLADIGPEGIQPLINVLLNPKAQSRFTFALALGRYAGKEHLWRQRKPRVPEEVEYAARIIVPILVSCLNDADRDVRNASIRSLSWFAREPGPAAEKAIPMLLLRAADTNAGVREIALDALGVIHAKPEMVVPVLIKCVNDPAGAVRYKALFALGFYREEAAAAVAALLGNLKDPNSDSRRYTATTLGRIHAESSLVVPALMELLQDSDPILRADVAEALGGFGVKAKEALPAMVHLLDDKEERARVAATNALRAIDPEAAAKAGVK